MRLGNPILSGDFLILSNFILIPLLIILYYTKIIFLLGVKP